MSVDQPSQGRGIIVAPVGTSCTLIHLVVWRNRRGFAATSALWVLQTLPIPCIQNMTVVKFLVTWRRARAACIASFPALSGTVSLSIGLTTGMCGVVDMLTGAEVRRFLHALHIFWGLEFGLGGHRSATISPRLRRGTS